MIVIDSILTIQYAVPLNDLVHDSSSDIFLAMPKSACQERGPGGDGGGNGQP